MSNYLPCSVSEPECEEKLQDLKSNMCKAFNYSQGNLIYSLSNYLHHIFSLYLFINILNFTSNIQQVLNKVNNLLHFIKVIFCTHFHLNMFVCLYV